MTTLAFLYRRLGCALLAALVLGLVTLGLPRTSRADYDPFIGEISCGGWNFCPMNWVECSGQLLPIYQNMALFSLIGTTYGGDGISNFALPNLMGKTMIHQGQGAGLSNRTIGETGGAERVALTSQQIPSHNHTTFASSGSNRSSPTGGVPGSSPASSPIYSTAQPNTALAAAAVGTAGESQPHNNLQPYLAVRCCIAVSGIFPTRD